MFWPFQRDVWTRIRSKLRKERDQNEKILEQPMNRSKHPTTFYIGKPDQLLEAEIVENGIRKGPVKDIAQARIKSITQSPPRGGVCLKFC